MTSYTLHKTSPFYPALLKVGLILLCLMIVLPAAGQNTKGDKPGNRESRFKLPFKKGKQQKRKGPSGKRVKPKGKSFGNSAVANFFSRKGRSASARSNGTDRPGRPIRPIYSSRPSNRQQAWRGDISGHRIRAKTKPAKTKLYPQRGPFVHNTSRKPRNVSRPVSNRTTLARLHKLQGPESPRPGKKRRIIPRSASGSFVARRSNNAWKRFPSARKKGEVAYTKDIAGRPLRTKNFETKKPELSTPTFRPYSGRKRIGDRPYKGPGGGGYVSRTKSRERAWRGDVAGRRIRGRNFFSKGTRVETSGQPTLPIMRVRPRRDRAYRGSLPGGGYKSASQPGEKRTGRAPIAPRVPGIGALGIGKYQGRIKSRRPAKGGGSVSGRVWNNRGQAIVPKAPGIGADRVGTFQGNIKSRRPAKGGGSVSGRIWNNRQSAIPVRPPSSTGMKAGGYPGKIKRFSLQPGLRDQGEEYTGYVRAHKPKKGGGSVSGKVWNNRQQPIVGKTVGAGAMRVGSYQGNIKARRPQKGGGSVSGKLWNNKETPIPVRTPPQAAEEQAKYPGKIKRFTVQPGFADQGEEFTGYIKLPWYRRAYTRNPNGHEKAIKKRSPDQTTYMVGNLHNAVKRRKYVENSNAADEALRKLQPTKATYQVGELQIKVKQREIGRKPRGAEGSLPGIKPTRETVKASQYARGVKRTWDYIRNPSSSKSAMKVREPGKAFARATDYQGNIKMRKFDLFGRPERHPDTQFVKINKNNVAEERGFLTNIKLWWAKTFKKNDNLPDHLKEKGRKPRYDKGEQGLWYD